MQSTSQLSRVRRDECKPRPDGSCRKARWVESCGARDDSPSWNLGREGDTIRVDDTSPRGRWQEDVKKSESGGASECSKVKYKAKPLSGVLS